MRERAIERPTRSDKGPEMHERGELADKKGSVYACTRRARGMREQQSKRPKNPGCAASQLDY